MNNALKYVKLLEKSGVTREQAETHIQIISEFLEGTLATKQDLNNLESKLTSQMNSLETTVINGLDKIEHKILQSEYRSTIKLGSIVTIAVAAATAIGKLF